MDILSIVVTAAFGFISSMLAYLLQQSHKQNKKLNTEQQKRAEALEDGMVCVLRKHLMDEHEFWMSKGYITPKALESGLLMYKAYKTLGGNGMIDHMEEEIQELPVIEKPKEFTNIKPTKPRTRKQTTTKD